MVLVVIGKEQYSYEELKNKQNNKQTHKQTTTTTRKKYKKQKVGGGEQMNSVSTKHFFGM